MDRGTAVLLTLVGYKLVLLGIGLFAQRRTQNEADFYLGGRKLGPLVAAISASASSSSAWTLLGVSGYAALHGLAALWLFPACVGGFAVNWYLIAPRLRRQTGEALTLTEYLAGTGKRCRGFMALASAIILVCLLTYVASQFRGAGTSFEETFKSTPMEIGSANAILIGAAVVVAYTLLGGFWAVSITDTVQGLLMALTAAVLPIAALVAVGGFQGMIEGIRAVPETSVMPGAENYLSLTREYGGPLGIGFVLGLFGITVSYPGQPHVVNRFMALKDEASLRRARLYAMAWALVVYTGMIVLGLCARVLVEAGEVAQETGWHEKVFIAMTNDLFSPVIAGVMIAAVLSAIMSTADSQLLVAASTVSHDLGVSGRSGAHILRNSRFVVLALSAGAVMAALWTSETIFNQVLFAFAAMGCAFGPILVVTLWIGEVPSTPKFISMATGFSLSVAMYYLGSPLTTTAFEQQFLPFFVALPIALVPALRLRARMKADQAPNYEA